MTALPTATGSSGPQPQLAIENRGVASDAPDLRACAHATARALDSTGAAILLYSRAGGLRVAAAWGSGHVVTTRRPREPENRPAEWRRCAARAIAAGRPIVVPFSVTPQRQLRLIDGTSIDHASLAVAPVRIATSSVGVLITVRGSLQPWTPTDLGLLRRLARGASQTVCDAEQAKRRVRHTDGLKHLSRNLRQEAHEHANRLHAIDALIDLGEIEEARAFTIELMRRHHRPSTLVGRVAHRALSGLLLAEITLAQECGVTLSITPDSRADQLPPRLSESACLGLVGNLLAYAYDGIATVPTERREVALTLIADTSGLMLRVRDPGRPSCDGPAHGRGAHDGCGEPLSQALLRDMSRRAGARVTFEGTPSGSLTTVQAGRPMAGDSRRGPVLDVRGEG